MPQLSGWPVLYTDLQEKEVLESQNDLGWKEP